MFQSFHIAARTEKLAILNGIRREETLSDLYNDFFVSGFL